MFGFLPILQLVVKKKYLTMKFLYSMICAVMRMKQFERIVEQTLLYDFYGELLTEHQKLVYENIVFNDLSYSEVAKEQGISRQGVYDLVKRCDKVLEEYEAKLHLIDKFLNTKQRVERINDLVQAYRETKEEQIIEQIQDIATEILNEA